MAGIVRASQLWLGICVLLVSYHSLDCVSIQNFRLRRDIPQGTVDSLPKNDSETNQRTNPSQLDNNDVQLDNKTSSISSDIQNTLINDENGEDQLAMETSEHPSRGFIRFSSPPSDVESATRLGVTVSSPLPVTAKYEPEVTTYRAQINKPDSSKETLNNYDTDFTRKDHSRSLSFEKYTNSKVNKVDEGNFKSSTINDFLKSSEDFYNEPLTTPSSDLFDRNHDLIQEEIKGKLKYLEDDDNDNDEDNENDSAPDVESLLSKHSDNDTDVSINYLSSASIEHVDKSKPNGKHRDISIENGTHFDFQSNSLKTQIINEESYFKQPIEELQVTTENVINSISTESKLNPVTRVRFSVKSNRIDYGENNTSPTNDTTKITKWTPYFLSTSVPSSIDPLFSDETTDNPIIIKNSRNNTKRGSIKYNQSKSDLSMDDGRNYSLPQSTTVWSLTSLKPKLQDSSSQSSDSSPEEDNIYSVQVLPESESGDRFINDSNFYTTTTETIATSTEGNFEMKTTTASFSETTIESTTVGDIDSSQSYRTKFFTPTTYKPPFVSKAPTTTEPNFISTTLVPETTVSITEQTTSSLNNEYDYTDYQSDSFFKETTTENSITTTMHHIRFMKSTNLTDEEKIEATTENSPLLVVTTDLPSTTEIIETTTDIPTTLNSLFVSSTTSSILNNTIKTEEKDETSTENNEINPIDLRNQTTSTEATLKKESIIQPDVETTTKKIVSSTEDSISVATDISYKADKIPEIVPNHNHSLVDYDDTSGERFPEITSEANEDVKHEHKETENDAKTLPGISISPSTVSSISAETTTHESDHDDTSAGTVAAIVISSIAGISLILLALLLFIMRKRQKRVTYGQRCTPVSLDAYSLDNISVYNSVRRKAARASKRSYGNPAFEDPVSVSHVLSITALNSFVRETVAITKEYEDIPQITVYTNEVPPGCETKNRYANVIPLPETRVFLSLIEGDPHSDYINANFVKGSKMTQGNYIATQAPMENTIDDFWRMIWEQQCKVIIMLTNLVENGVEKCYDYLPPSEVSDCNRQFGDFQVTLKNRDVNEKYIVSSLQLKNMVSNSWREVTHFWYLGWPERGVPQEATSIMNLLVEVRRCIKSSNNNTLKLDSNKENESNGFTNGHLDAPSGVITVHCSPGTGRTGTVIACDIASRELEVTRQVDLPQIVYNIRRARAGAVQTRDQYAYIYKVIDAYATKLTGGAPDSI